MSNQYPGGFITKSPTAPTSSAAPGMWTLGQAMQNKKAGNWPSPPLYPFTSATFYPGSTATTTERIGRTAPTLSEYIAGIIAASGTGWTTNTDYLNITSDSFILWTVPKTGTYRITAAGAKGGNAYRDWLGNYVTGGYGASMAGNFSLTQGQKLWLLPGKMGNDTPSTESGGAGGGGGSFVTIVSPTIESGILVIAAGGGGATAYIDRAPNSPGGVGNTGTSGAGTDIYNPAYGTTAPGSGGGAAGGGGGSNGYGGGAGLGGGGGGFYDRGAYYSSDFDRGGGGFLASSAPAPSTKMIGGNTNWTANANGMLAGLGGWGGGGGAQAKSGYAGGGGGYSGGGGGSFDGTSQGNGGGGGSYNNGASQTNTAGANPSVGYITVEFVA